jgi:mannose-1-phosphate guanylyltransferase
MQIIINAGGSGTRLWPLSTKALPKQFAPLIDHQSLLQKTYFRLTQDYRIDDIWVTTNQDHIGLVNSQLCPNYNFNHTLFEPERRDTFAAVIAHSAIVASKTSKDETLVFISSDHYFDPNMDQQSFVNTLATVDNSIQANAYPIILPVTKPYFPSTAYGYVKSDFESNKVTKVLEFKEKPNQLKANEFIESGNYFWNLGYFAFKYTQLLRIVKELYPELESVMNNIYSKGSIDLEDYQQIQKTSFDFAILEKLTSIGAIDMNLTTWDDIGNFETLSNYIPTIDSSNHIQVQGIGNKYKSNNVSQRKVAFVGVDNLLLIESDDAIMIIDPTKSTLIKEVSQKFDN